MPNPRSSRRRTFWVTSLVVLFAGIGGGLVEAQSGDTASASTASGPAATFDLQRDRQPMASLDGLWRFHPGDDPDSSKGWAQPDFDDSSWALLRSDKSWSDQGYQGMSGFGWYRFAITIPSDTEPLVLQLGPTLTTYRIFIDGQPEGGFGRMPPNIAPRAAWNYHDFPIPSSPPGQKGRPRVVHVALRVWHSPIWSSYLGGGPQIGGHLVGNAEMTSAQTMFHERSRRLLFVDLYSYTIAAFIVSLTIAGLFFFRPTEREYLWFAILLMAKATDSALNISREVYAFPSIPIFDVLDGGMVAIAQAALLLFLTKVLGLRRGIFLNVLLGMALISSFFNVLYWPGWLSVAVSALLTVIFLFPSSIWMLATLAHRAIRRNPTARLLLVPVLLVQGLYIVDNLTAAINQFGFPIDARHFENPFVTSPYTMHPSVLAELLFLFAMLAFLIRRFTIARRREERWEGALEAARQVQQVLLPEAIPHVEGFEIDCIYRPAEIVGGDFFQILPVGDGELLVVIGDVAGKGLPAAMMVSMLVGAVRTEVAHEAEPARLLAILNERMTGRSQASFTTCLCARVSAQGRVEIANAGHPAPYCNGRELELPGALPLGVMGGATYETSVFSLLPGDFLTFLSDGVIEAQDKAGRLLGFDRTQVLSKQPAVEIAEAASLFGQVDDITVVSIAFHGTEAVNAMVAESMMTTRRNAAAQEPLH